MHELEGLTSIPALRSVALPAARQWRGRTAAALALALGGALCAWPADGQRVSVRSVPYRAHDPAIPHPAYNGHPTTLKAIGRGGCESPYFRWDADGNGTWDDCEARSKVATPGGWWYRDGSDRLDCRYRFPWLDPTQTPRKLYLSTIQATCAFDSNGNPVDPGWASTYTLVRAEVPVGRAERPDTGTFAYSARPSSPPGTCLGGTCTNSGFPCASDRECAGDDAESLELKREVALEDALWYLHKQLTRTGTGTATISGYVGAPDSPGKLVDSAWFLRLLALNGHSAGYPPGTYGLFGNPPPPDWDAWTADNDFRFDNDPYAEDAVRLLNYLLASLRAFPVGANAEEDDGRTPIPGTNDLTGWGAPGEDPPQTGQVLAALAASGMQGTLVQVDGVAPVKGQSIELVVQQIVDLLAELQCAEASPGNGGWSDASGPCGTGRPLSFATHYAVDGLAIADGVLSGHGVIVPRGVKFRLPNYLALCQSPNGSGTLFCPTPDTSPDATGGAFVAGHAWIGSNGFSASDPSQSFAPFSDLTNGELRSRYDAALGYLAETWTASLQDAFGFNSSSWETPGSRFDGLSNGSTYAHLAIATGLRALEPALPLLPTGTGAPIAWFDDFQMSGTNNQHRDGFVRDLWCPSLGCADPNLGASIPRATAWAAVAMTPRRKPPGLSLLTVSKSGLGTVTSADGAIRCGDDCERRYFDDAVVRLEAAPDTGFVFAGWSSPSGACAGVGPCAVAMDVAREVSAIFDSLPPEAGFSVTPSPALVGQVVTFDAAASRHPNPGRSIVSWEWAFGDGGTGSGVVGTHVFGGCGPYEVTLTVTDDGAPALQDQATAAVTLTLPTPVITAPASVLAGVPFTASVPAVAGVTYSWTVTNGIVTGGIGTPEITVAAAETGSVTIAVTETIPAAGCASGEASISIPVALPATRFYPVIPCRLFDTRNAAGLDAASPALNPGQTRVFTVGTRCGLDVATVRSLSVNQTVTEQTADGELVLWRGDLESEPLTSNLGFRLGRARANNALLELSRAGDGSFKVTNRSAGTVHFILDVNGVFK